MRVRVRKNNHSTCYPISWAMREHQVVGRSINLPDEIATPINILIENVKSIGKPKQKAIIMELHEWEDGFMDVTEYERQCKSENRRFVLG